MTDEQSRPSIKRLSIGILVAASVLSFFLWFNNTRTGSGGLWLIKWIFLGAFVFIGFIIYADYSGKKYKERLDRLRAHINGQDLAKRDLKEIRSMLDGSRATGAFNLLQEDYGDSGKALIQILAEDDRDLSQAIIRDVVEKLESDQEQTHMNALRTLSLIKIPQRHIAHRVAKKAVKKLHESEEEKERAICLRILHRNRNQIPHKLLEQHRKLIAAQLEIDDPEVRTEVAALAAKISSYRTRSGVELLPGIIFHLDKLLNTVDGDDSSPAMNGRLVRTTRYVKQIMEQCEDVPDAIKDNKGVFIRCLDVESDPARRFASFVIAKTVDTDPSLPAAVLIDHLDDPSDVVQKNIAEALALLEPDEIPEPETRLPSIIDLLQYEDRRARAGTYLLKSLYENHSDMIAEDIDHIEALLGSEDAPTRRYGYSLLAKAVEDHPGMVAPHFSTILDALEKDEKAGTAALGALYQFFFIHDAELAVRAGSSLVPYLDAGGETKQMAAQMLAAAARQDPDQFRSLRPVFESMLDNDDPEVIRQGCVALKAVGTEESREKLKALLEHSSHKVRVAATKAYKTIGDESMQEDEEPENIHIEADGTIEGDVLVNADKTEIDELDESKEIKDSVMKDVDLD